MPHFFGRDTARRVQARQSRADGRFLRAHGRQASGVFGFAHRPLWPVVGQRGLIRIGSRPHTLCPPARTVEGRVAARTRRRALLRLAVWVLVADARTPVHLDVCPDAKAPPPLGRGSGEGEPSRVFAEERRETRCSYGAAAIVRSTRAREVRLDGLADEIRNAVNEGSEKRVYLEADARGTRTSTGPVEIRKAGIENVSIVTNTPLLPPDQKVVLRFPPGFRKPVPVRPITP
jgi:hypothetical protein